MGRNKRWLTASTVALMLFAATACRTDKVIFVREDVKANGAPRQILKLTEATTADAAYFDGSEWVVAPDVTIPSGWLIVSPQVIEDDE